LKTIKKDATNNDILRHLQSRNHFVNDAGQKIAHHNQVILYNRNCETLCTGGKTLIKTAQSDISFIIKNMS